VGNEPPPQGSEVTEAANRQTWWTSRFHTRLLLTSILALALTSCTTTPKSGITLKPVPKAEPPDPAAFSHFVNARLSEMLGERNRAIASLRAAIAIDTASATLYSALARNLVAENRFAEAVVPARRSLHLASNDQTTRWIYYESLMAITDTATALGELEILTRQDPNPLKALDQMHQIYRARDNQAAVLRTLDQIVALPELSEQGKLIASQNYQYNGQHDKAEALLKDVLQQNPERSDAWVKLANLQVVRKDTLAGAKSLRAALADPNGRIKTMPVWRQLAGIYGPQARLDSLLAEDPPDAAFLEQLGEVYRQLGRSDAPKTSVPLLERALALFNKLTKVFPDHAHLFAKQGELLLNLNRPVDARNSFIHAGKLDDRPEYHLGTAHSLLFERLYEPAIEILERIQPLTPVDSEFFEKTVISLGNAYGATGQSESARKLYQETIERTPDITAFRYELGETYIRDGNWDAATTTFRALLPLVEEEPVNLGQTLYGLARTLERSGEFDESVRMFERLLSLHPKHADALNYLGYMFAEKGVRLGEAASFIQRALEADPKNGAYLDSLGWVYFQAEDYRRAQEFLQKAIDQEESEVRRVSDPGRRKAIKENLSVIYDHAGDCAHALNQFEAARGHWKRAIASDPNIPGTLEKLEKLNANHGSRTEGAVAP
jgi:tetratricopeptide (TPR) repeat protein